jgi:hypothetical protein
MSFLIDPLTIFAANQFKPKLSSQRIFAGYPS